MERFPGQRSAHNPQTSEHEGELVLLDRNAAHFGVIRPAGPSVTSATGPVGMRKKKKIGRGRNEGEITVVAIDYLHNGGKGV